MLSNNDTVQGQLWQLLARNNAVQQPDREGGQRSAAHLQLNPGQQVKAEIISTLSNHLYLARVAGELFKLEIPLVVHPGQSVPLTLVAVKPRVVFELHRQEGGEAVSLSFLGKRLAESEHGGEPVLPEDALPGDPLLEGGEFLPGGSPELTDGGIPLPSRGEEQRSAAKLLLAPGQQVKGEVLESLPKNVHLVMVGGERFLTELPQGVQKGETVTLSFIGAVPQVLFELVAAEGPAEPVRLSSLGKWLAGAPREGEGAVPLQGALVNQPTDANLLAARLKEALSQGGLFYESHLAQWAAGALPLQEILKEPQGRISRARRPSDGEGEAREGTGNGIADDRTLPLVREQLLLLNTRVLSFKGEPWPGQEMALTIGEGEEHAEPGVEAKLSLELPSLGAVQARVRLGEHGVELEIVTGRRDSSELLKTGGGELRAASSAAGVHLFRVSVRHESEGE